MASNTDESYNPDVGSETESRASERIHSAEIGRYSSWVKAEVDIDRTNCLYALLIKQGLTAHRA